jgi:mannose-6-phosphate isomerase
MGLPVPNRPVGYTEPVESLYPLRLKPAYQPYPWGGDRIIRLYHRPEPAGTYAESWEVSDRPEGMSVVGHGPLAGATLQELVDRHGPALVGADAPAGRFPLLIKLIDARERLSAQVHPDDEGARRHGGEAKTEMWYLLDADPGARVFAGLRPGADERTLRDAIRTGDFERLLKEVPVQKDDAVFMPGGRVHAIDAGCFILEIQQNSNTTYRLYDWGRTDAGGRPRPLHLEEALRVIRWDDAQPVKWTPRRLGFLAANELWEIGRCPYFRLERLRLQEDWESAMDGRSFHVLFVASGAVGVTGAGTTELLPAGSTVLMPAALPGYRLDPGAAPAEVLRITRP